MKYEYINTGIEWIGDIPKHWKVTTIKKEFQVIPSNVDKKTEDNETEVKLCNYVDVYYNDFINPSIDFMVASATENEINKFQLKLGDVLITKDSEDPFDIAVPALVKHTEDKLLCGYHLSMIRSINNSLDGSFLFWALKDEVIATQLWREACGVTRWAIASRHIKNSTIPFPPKPEQIAIANYLDKACSDIERVVGIKRKQIENLQQQLKSIIYQTVTKGINKESKLKESNEEWLGRIPQNWKIDRLKDLVELRNEKTDEKSDIEDYLELEDLEKETGRILGFRNTEEVASKVTIFKKDDVLFGKLRPYLNKHYLAKEDGKCTGEILAFKCKKILNRYFEYCISSHGFIETCTIISYGAKMPRVDYTTQLAYFYLPLPSPNEQEIICDTLDKIKEKNFIVQSKIEKQLENILAYKKSLIHEVVTGKKQVYGLSKEKTKLQTA
jgi:type I restriction enzyme, S subunit